jgi:hypothetical protein
MSRTLNPSSTNYFKEGLKSPKNQWRSVVSPLFLLWFLLVEKGLGSELEELEYEIWYP